MGQDMVISDPTQLARPVVLMVWSKKENESLSLHPLSVGGEAMDVFPSSRHVLARLLKYVLSDAAKERLSKRAIERKKRKKDQQKKDGKCGDDSCHVDHGPGANDPADISADTDAPASGGSSGPATHRLPRTVVFEDRPLAEGCYASLAALGIKVVLDKPSTASPSFWGFPYVSGTNRINLYGPLKEISNMFLSKSVGMLRPEANYSGFTITSGVSKHVLRHFLEIANEFRLANPWERLTPQVPIRVQFKKDPLTLAANENEFTDPIWGVVARQVQPNTAAPNAPPTLVPSLGLFFRRYDIERKILIIPPSEREKQKQGGKQLLSFKAKKNPYDLVCNHCGKRGDPDALADANETDAQGSSESVKDEASVEIETMSKSGFSVCASCQDAIYCSIDCLKQDAAKHKEHCEKWKVAPRTEPHFPVRELLLVYLPSIALPMDDIDTYTSLGLLNTATGIYPHLIAKDTGGRKAPIVESDVIHYTRVMKAILGLMQSMQEDISVPVFRPDTYLNLDSTKIVYDHAEYSFQTGNYPIVHPFTEPLNDEIKETLERKREALLPWYKNDPGAPKLSRTRMAVEGAPHVPSISEEYAAYREVLPEALVRVDPIVNAETYSRIQAEIQELGKTDEAWRHAMMLKIAAETPEDHARAQEALEKAGTRKSK